MFDSLPGSIGLFLGAALIIAVAGVQLTIRAQQLAVLTGLGELLTGAVLIGLITSLSGLVTTITAAHSGHASLAMSNALGGIAVQTLFLAIADMVYRSANLEHAAASEANLLQGAVLIVLLTLPLLAITQPGFTVAGIHPVSVMLVAGYLFGLRLMNQAQRRPMWLPRVTRQTYKETKATGKATRRNITVLWLGFVCLGVLVAGAGWVLAQSAITISVRVGLAESVVGGILTAVTTSLPELVVAIAAVRRGALSLAVGDILGGNTFDVLFLAAADAAYRDGSVYTAAGQEDIFWIALAILLTGVLLLGLIRREKHGIGNIGFESFLVLILYFVGVIALAVH